MITCGWGAGAGRFGLSNGLFSAFSVFSPVLCSERCLIFLTKEMKTLSKNLLNVYLCKTGVTPAVYGPQTNSKG